MRSTSTASPFLQARLWRACAWTGVLLIGGMLVMALAGQQWKMTGALAVFLAAGFGILRLPHLPNLLRFLLVLAAAVNGAGGAFDWFVRLAWYDEFAHAYTGFAGLAAIGYLYARELALPRAHLVWWCIGMGLVLGGGWEVVEALGGELEFMDTLSDLVLDAVGAALGGAFAWHALGVLGPQHGLARAR